MQAVLWIVIGVSPLLTLAGWTFLGIAQIFPTVDVTTRDIHDWFKNQAIAGAFIGVGVGVAGALLTARRLAYRASESGSDYCSRVAGCGLWTIGAAVLICTLVSAGSAWLAAVFPVAPLQRVYELLFSPPFWFRVCAPTVFFAGLLFALVSRLRRWGGRYAVLNSRWRPALGRYD